MTKIMYSKIPKEKLNKELCFKLFIIINNLHNLIFEFHLYNGKMGNKINKMTNLLFHLSLKMKNEIYKRYSFLG